MHGPWPNGYRIIMQNDLSVQLLRHGYEALPRLWRQADPWSQSRDGVLTRMLGRRTLVVRGEEGARLFYDQDVLRRSDAMPAPLANLLFGAGAVHGLDGEAHLARKKVFLDVLSAESVAALADDVDARLVEAMADWPRRAPLSVFDELVSIYGSSVLAWSGVTTREKVAKARSRQLAALVDGFGFAPVAYARARAARTRLNRWATALVDDARARRSRPPEGSALEQIALGGGAGLSSGVAGVELLNVLRPTVAVAWLGTFAVQALAEHSAEAAGLGAPRAHRERWAFAEEVRRHYRFVPALAARVHQHSTWHGYDLDPGMFVVLDVPGTNADPGRWYRPESFIPGRFLTSSPSAYDFVSQGGGEVETGHRCPGEGIAMSLLERTLLRCSQVAFSVTTGDTDWTRIPARPPAGLRLTECRTDLPALSGSGRAKAGAPNPLSVVY